MCDSVEQEVNVYNFSLTSWSLSSKKACYCHRLPDAAGCGYDRGGGGASSHIVRATLTVAPADVTVHAMSIGLNHS